MFIWVSFLSYFFVSYRFIYSFIYIYIYIYIYWWQSVKLMIAKLTPTCPNHLQISQFRLETPERQLSRINVKSIGVLHIQLKEKQNTKKMTQTQAKVANLQWLTGPPAIFYDAKVNQISTKAENDNLLGEFTLANVKRQYSCIRHVTIREGKKCCRGRRRMRYQLVSSILII